MPAEAGLYYGMLARRARYERLDDMRVAAVFKDLQPTDQRSLWNQISFFLRGPLRPERWEDRLSAFQREEIAKIEREQAETIAKIKARTEGLMIGANGQLPIEALLRKG